MPENLKIAMLCNSKMAFPTLHSLHAAGVLCSLATADTDREVVNMARETARQFNVPYCCFTKEGLERQMLTWLDETKPEAVFVVTFPWKISETVLNTPEFGFINFHYGLLPEMRGADPIFESIRNRKPFAGVTVYSMDGGWDTGSIIYREQIPLMPDFTYGMLSSHLSQMGEQLCRRLVSALKNGAFPESVAQDETKAQYWPRVGEDAITLNWNEMDAETIFAIVRSCNPITKGAPVALKGWKIGICDVSDVNLQGDASAIAPGTILAIDAQNGLIVCCKGGKAVRIEVIYTAEGIFPGHKLSFFGFAPGMVFG